MLKKSLIIAAVVAPVVVVSAIAQQSAIKRTPLQTVDFPAGYNVVTAIAEVPAGSYSDVLVTNDRDLLDLNKDEDKYFAPGVGLVKLGGLVNGHREDVWTNEKYMQSLLGGIRWMLALEPGDATPNPELSSAQEAKAKADYEAAQQK